MRFGFLSITSTNLNGFSKFWSIFHTTHPASQFMFDKVCHQRASLPLSSVAKIGALKRALEGPFLEGPFWKGSQKLRWVTSAQLVPKSLLRILTVLRYQQKSEKHIFANKSAVCLYFFKVSVCKIIYNSRAIFYILWNFSQPYSVFLQSSLKFRNSKKFKSGHFGVWLSSQQWGWAWAQKLYQSESHPWKVWLWGWGWATPTCGFLELLKIWASDS